MKIKTNIFLRLFLFSFLIHGSALFSQQFHNVEKTGKITYVSSQNVYVQFENTDGIKVGDTLFVKKNNLIPSIIVKFISSTSCAGELIKNTNLKVGDKLIAIAKIKDEEVTLSSDTSSKKINNTSIVEESAASSPRKKFRAQSSNFDGRFSIQSYSDLSNNNFLTDYQRWRYTLSLNAQKISGSNFSFYNYMSFSYRADQWNSISSNLGQNLRVYDLSFKYDFNKTTDVWVGRHLNNKISSISSIDGIQLEKSFDKYFSGVVIGSAPNFTDLGYNIKLFEFGGFFGRTDSLKNGYMENSIAIFQQTNDFKIDRRFLYFQHSNNIIKNLSLFLSSEFDLYKKSKGKATNDLSLTGLFFSARYSPHRIVSFSASYDARRNVIYYETYKTFIDSLIDNETRQGLRFNTNIRPINYLFVGLNAGYRFQKGDIRTSNNYSGYLTYSRIPIVELSSTIAYSTLQTNYTKGSNWGINFSKYNILNNIDLTVGYRKNIYEFQGGIEPLKQDVFSIDTYLRIIGKLTLSASYEGTFENQRTSSRVLMGISSRF